MKAKPLISFLSLCLWLGPGSLPLPAREPARNLQDLTKLESKVEQVSRKVLPATVALLSDRTGSSGSGVITTR